MNEIEKILKDNMEDYESVKRQALKFIHENKKELSKNYAYAEVCGNPVDASHFFFLIDEKKPGSDLLLEMLDYALKKYVSSEKASVTTQNQTKITDYFPEDLLRSPVLPSDRSRFYLLSSSV